jgi:AcrR family transcriptional regulator
MQSRSVATINSILDAARGLFIEKPYADVTLREITELAGVTKGALYHHFPTKEELYSQLIHRCLADVKEAIEDALISSEGESARDQLQKGLASFLRLSPDIRGIMRSIRRNINIFENPMRSELIKAYQEALPEQVEMLLAAGMARGEIVSTDPRLLSWQHVAVVEVTLYQYDRGSLGDPEEVAESVVKLFFDGIEIPQEQQHQPAEKTWQVD